MKSDIMIAIFFNKSFVSNLTKLFTGCRAYHIAFINPETATIYEMDARRRMRKWDLLTFAKNVETRAIRLFDCPVPIDETYLREQTEIDPKRYGVLDYLHFALRGTRKFFGLPLKNYAGVICSEMINRDLIKAGWNSPWPNDGPPPSPCDFLRYFTRME